MVVQVQSWQAEQTTQQKAREVVTTSRSLSGCLEMAQVQRMGESLSKKLLDSKTACRLADEAAREQLERQRDVEKCVCPLQQLYGHGSHANHAASWSGAVANSPVKPRLIGHNKPEVQIGTGHLMSEGLGNPRSPDAKTWPSHCRQ